MAARARTTSSTLLLRCAPLLHRQIGTLYWPPSFSQPPRFRRSSGADALASAVGSVGGGALLLLALHRRPRC